ncbi:MAG: glycosyltransferase family 2 protein, partial [Rudaea sp.]
MLTVVVLTRNEEKHIAACLESVRGFADELVVFDSHSDDATPEVAEKLGAKLYQREFDDWANQRNAALAAAAHDWVFFVDAVERADISLGEEIHARIADGESDPNAAVLYWVPRKNYIFGKWIRYTGWSPDYQPRVMRRDRAHFDPARPVHELVIAGGAVGYLSCPLVHLNYENIAQFRKKQMLYTRLEAQELYEQGLKPRARGLIGQPVREFARRFISLRGYRDGAHGLLLSLLMAYYAFVRQRLL